MISLVRALYVGARRLLRRDRPLPESYVAQQAIREIKHQAISELLANARASHRYGDVIEGTAVELPSRRMRR